MWYEFTGEGLMEITAPVMHLAGSYFWISRRAFSGIFLRPYFFI